jgi:hypothetical protein
LDKLFGNGDFRRDAEKGLVSEGGLHISPKNRIASSGANFLGLKPWSALRSLPAIHRFAPFAGAVEAADFDR